MKKLNKSSDAYPNDKLNQIMAECIEQGEYSYVENILNIFKDRATTYDPMVLTDVIYPRLSFKGSVLRYFDKINKPEEALNYIKMVEELMHDNGIPYYIKSNICDIASILKQAKIPLSDKMTTVLQENGYL